MKRRHGGTLALIFLIGCSSPSAPREAPEASEGPAERAEAEPASTTSGGCRVGAPTELGRTSERPRHLALSLSDESGWLFVEGRDGALEATRIDDSRDLRSAPRALTDATPGALRFALPVGQGHLALSEGDCVVEGESRRCLLAVALPATHGGPALTHRVPLPGPIHTMRRRRSERSLWVARSHPRGRPAVDVFSVEGGRIGHREIPLGEGVEVGERSSEILGLAVEGQQWAALWRHGAIEDPEGELLLSSAAGVREFEPLHHALLIDSFGFTDEGLAAIATFEFARAHLYRFDLSARPLGAPETVAPGEPIPSPFGESVRVSLADDGERLWLTRANGAGDRVGAPVEVARRSAANLPADVAKVGRRYVVAFVTSSSEGWRLMRRDVSCPSTATPP